VVVDDFDFFGISVRPDKTDSVSVVDAHAPLASPISRKRLEAIAGRSPEIIEALCHIELPELAQGGAFNEDESRHSTQPEKRLGLCALERLDRH
jgi:hypothetical protein